MENSELTAEVSYNEIENKANSNSLIQGITGIVGFPFTLGADIAVIGTHYVPLFHKIRDIYGRKPTNIEDHIQALLKNITPELLADLVIDKFLGNVPVAGIYFNAICAKAMTWRLGTLFAMLSARGEEIHYDKMQDSMKVIREIFPQNDMFKFSTPDKQRFIKLVTSFENISPEDFNVKIDKILNSL